MNPISELSPRSCGGKLVVFQTSGKTAVKRIRSMVLSPASKKGDMMIYIGKFLYTTNQQAKDENRRRHGEFNLLVSAPDKNAAVETFKQRIDDARTMTGFFEGESYIYLMHILEMEEVPADRARMFNFQSVAGDPVMPFISCQAPSGDGDGCRILDWQKNRPGVDGQAATPFVQFRQ